MKIKPPNQLWNGRFATDGRPKTENRNKISSQKRSFAGPRSAAKLPSGQPGGRFPGATVVQPGWKGWKLCSVWTVYCQLHREDGQGFPPDTGWTPLSHNSKSDALSIELRVRLAIFYIRCIFRNIQLYFILLRLKLQIKNQDHLTGTEIK